MSKKEKSVFEIMQEKTDRENSRMMDDTTFKELFEAGELGLILADGGTNLTQRQLRLVREKAKEQTQDLLIQKQLEVAAQPGYAESILTPLVRKIMEQSVGAPTVAQKTDTKQEMPKGSKISAPSQKAMAKTVAVEPKVKKVAEPKKYAKRAIEKISKKTSEALSSISSFPAFFDFMRKENSEYHEQMENMQRELENRKQARHKEVMDIIISATQNKRKADKKIKSQIKKDKVEQKKEETKPSTAPAPKTEASTPKVEAAKTTTPAPQTAPTTTPPTTPATKPPTAQQLPQKPVTTAPPVKETPAMPKTTTTAKPVTEVAKQATTQAISKAGAPQIAKIMEVGKGYNVVQLANGQIVKQEGAWNWRNNNPGNIEYGAFALGMGAIPFAHGKDKPQTPEERFAVFPTYEMGRKAKEKLIFEQQKSSTKLGPYGELTLDKAIEKYAPPSENNTIAYQNTVKSALKPLGVTDDIIATRKMKEYTPEQRMAILNAMEKMEGYGVGKKSTQIVPPSTNLADKLNQTATENNNMKRDMKAGAGQQVIIQQNFHNNTNRQHFVPPTQKQELNPTMQ